MIINPYVFGFSLYQSYPISNHNAGISIDGDISNDYVGQSFVTTSGISITAIEYYLSKVGSPSNNLTANIWTDSGGLPSAITGSTATVAGGDIGASKAIHRFVFPTPVSLSGSTTYHMTCGYTENSSNYVSIGCDTSSPTDPGDCSRRPTGSPWEAFPITADLCYYLYI